MKKLSYLLVIIFVIVVTNIYAQDVTPTPTATPNTDPKSLVVGRVVSIKATYKRIETILTNLEPTSKYCLFVVNKTDNTTKTLDYKQPDLNLKITFVAKNLQQTETVYDLVLSETKQDNVTVINKYIGTVTVPDVLNILDKRLVDALTNSMSSMTTNQKNLFMKALRDSAVAYYNAIKNQQVQTLQDKIIN